MSPDGSPPSPDPTHASVAVDENEYNFEQEYKGIYTHINTFQVTIKNPDTLITRNQRTSSSATSTGIDSDIDILSSITVFKKKNARHMVSGSNIYQQDTSGYDLDSNDSSKSKSSCVRCRKFKKKCTRTLPECSNCVSSEELCVYLSRKSKRKRPESVQPTVPESTATSFYHTPLTELSNPPLINPDPNTPGSYFDSRNSNTQIHGTSQSSQSLSRSTSSTSMASSSRQSVSLVKLPSINNVLDTILPVARPALEIQAHYVVPTLVNPFQGSTARYVENTINHPPPLVSAVSDPSLQLNDPNTTQKRLSLPNLPVDTTKNRKRKSGDLNNLLN